nr:MAG: hypothetical protein [Bacteriophage sp.]
MIFHNASPIARPEQEEFCQYIAGRFRLSVFSFPSLSDERIDAQRAIQKEIDEWMLAKKLTTKQILEFNKRLNWLLR